jgi:hypothetical protein
MSTVDDTFCCSGRRLLGLGEVAGVGGGEGGALHVIKVM